MMGHENEYIGQEANLQHILDQEITDEIERYPQLTEEYRDSISQLAEEGNFTLEEFIGDVGHMMRSVNDGSKTGDLQSYIEVRKACEERAQQELRKVEDAIQSTITGLQRNAERSHNPAPEEKIQAVQTGDEKALLLALHENQFRLAMQLKAIQNFRGSEHRARLDYGGSDEFTASRIKDRQREELDSGVNALINIRSLRHALLEPTIK